MFTTLVMKELKSILLSPKFSATFAVCSLLILLSAFLGIREYKSTVKQFAAANDLVQQEMREARQWMAVNNRVYREPNPLQIFASGVQNDVGRYSGISSWSPVKLVHSSYSDDPIFAVFRFIDLSFIVQVVLTLLAILFTFDAVNGERETGTLQLTFSNAVPRVQFLTAKFLGTWLGLVAPLSVPFALSLLLLIIFGVPMTVVQWLQVGGFFGVALLLVTFFVAYGILISCLTKRSNVSFLFSLVSWVAFVLIIPRIGVMLAGQVVTVPTVAEIESQQDGYAKDRWNEMMKEMTATWRQREEGMKGFTKEQRKAKYDEMEWTWAEEDDARRKKVQSDIDENARKLEEGVRNMKLEQERVAYNFSRISPVAAFQIAVMNLSQTDIDVKTRYEDALNAYRTVFNKYKDRKQKESGSTGGIRISIDTNTGIKIDSGREMALDLSDLPQFRPGQASLAEIASQLPVDVGLLVLLTLLAFGGAMAAFLRYDVR